MKIFIVPKYLFWYCCFAGRGRFLNRGIPSVYQLFTEEKSSLFYYRTFKLKYHFRPPPPVPQRGRRQEGKVKTPVKHPLMLLALKKTPILYINDPFLRDKNGAS